MTFVNYHIVFYLTKIQIVVSLSHKFAYSFLLCLRILHLNDQKDNFHRMAFQFNIN